jgi:hypothetical protein
MTSTFLGLAAGLVCLLVCFGLGLGLLRRIGVEAPPYWQHPLALVCGVAILDLCVTLALVCGGGVRSLRIVAAVLTSVAAYELFFHRKRIRVVAMLHGFARGRWLAAIVLTALAINLFIALAPSSKIDETYYHMLVPARVITDDGLRVYREPYEAAFYPQLSFQIGMSALHAVGVPEAGNVLSWGLSAALIFFITGIVAELTGGRPAGWLAGGIAVVGIYTPVWHVTSGPHALGDVTMVLAACLCLLPETSFAWLREDQRLALMSLAACTSASTKISLLPLSGMITLLAVVRIAGRIGWLKTTGITSGIWAVFYLPLVIWSSVQTGSPFGLATASLFHSHFFAAGTIIQMDESRQVNQIGLMGALKLLAISVSGGMVVAAGIVAVRAWKDANCRILVGLVAIQTVFIAVLLPHDFRFLGGLQFVVLIFASSILSTRAGGKRWLIHTLLLAIPLCLPWLAEQVYYAPPFLAVALGLESRDSFLEKYVAFTPDFRKLNDILPKEAVLYVTNARPPSFYSPRPMIFTLKDYMPGHALYRFSVGNIAVQDAVSCTEVVYENPDAIIEAYRTPGRPPLRDSLRVTRCAVPEGSIF